MKRITLIALCVAVLATVSCGNNSKKKTSGQEAGNDTVELSESTQAAAPETKSATKKEEPKAQAKKWYEQDFSLTEKMYVSTASMTRTYARKGNVVISTVEGSGTTNLFVCTDDTRTQYLVNNEKGTYIKQGEKSDFDSVDDAIYQYLKGQMGNTIFGDRLKKDGNGVSAKDTTIFGRPAYVLTQEKTETVAGIELYTKAVEWVDKENGLPYYKYGQSKRDGSVIIDAKAFEVTAFSAKPTYEGLIVSLDGLTEITN